VVRALAFVLGLASLLLCASSAPSQPTACTRYENGRVYILPGCIGPGGSSGGRVHPFTGEPWGNVEPWGGDLPIVTWSAVAASAAMMSWPVTPVVEGSLAVRLRARFQRQTAEGARVQEIRITSKDLIAQLAQDLGVSGTVKSLVRRREVQDLAGEEAEIYLVVDGVEHLVESFIEPLPLSLPEGFYGSASAHTLRRRDGAVSTIEFLEVSAISVGDLALDGFTLHLFSLDGGRCVSNAVQGGSGYLCGKLVSKVTGGMQLPELSPESPLLVTGTLRIGPEKVVSP
jgi:hypothetical protein